jgi:hypothetical protein
MGVEGARIMRAQRALHPSSFTTRYLLLDQTSSF